MNPLHLAQDASSLEPRLTAFGLGVYGRRRRDAAQEFIRSRDRLLSREGLLEVAICAHWLRDGHASSDRGSYGLKHEVENHYDCYITNGSLIAAALGMGQPSIDIMRSKTIIHQLIHQPHDTPKIVSFTSMGIVIPRDVRRGATEQRTLRGRIVGIPAVTWKHHRWGATRFSPWPCRGDKRYLMVGLATRRHGVLTLPLPPSAASELLRLGAERSQPITDIDLVVSMIDRGNYYFATFAEARRRAS